jgi:hypothetical protein
VLVQADIAAADATKTSERAAVLSVGTSEVCTKRTGDSYQ